MNRPLILALLATALLTLPPAANAGSGARPHAGLSAPASVKEDHGVIVYRQGGRKVRLAGEGRDRMPALSPDGGWVVFVREGIPAEGHEATIPTALWLHDLKGGGQHRLLGETEDEESEKTQTGFNNPVFSNDGATVYVLGHAWVTSDVVLAVDVASGRAHFVTDGNSVAVIRNGPYRGDLLVSRHKYRASGGAYDPTDLLTPSGKPVLTIPGSARDEAAVGRWLKAHGWRAG
jgi:hypothetical protein